MKIERKKEKRRKAERKKDVKNTKQYLFPLTHVGQAMGRIYNFKLNKYKQTSMSKIIICKIYISCINQTFKT
jgi:hypothetical protein